MTNPTDIEALAALRDTFQIWLDAGPNSQPHYPSGTRPWSTGDLKAFVTALRTIAQDAEPVADEFLLARVSQDTRVIGIDHPTEAPWDDVLAAHIALRDRLNDRLAEMGKCPFNPSPSPAPQADAGAKAAVVTVGELLPCPWCRGMDLHVSIYDVQPDDYHGGYVTCIDCDAQGPNGITLDGWLSDKDEADKAARIAWNRYTRPLPTDDDSAAPSDKDAVIARLEHDLHVTGAQYAKVVSSEAALREALEPFAKYQTPYIMNDDEVEWGLPANTPHNVGAYRKARAALASRDATRSSEGGV